MIEKSCSRCGARFGCGRDDASCWCASAPRLAAHALEAGVDCYCPDCLRALASDERAPHRDATVAVTEP